MQLIREAFPKKFTLSFGYCPNWEGGPPGPIDFDTLLKVKKFPKLCEGAVYLLYAMPKSKGAFFWESFTY